MEPFIVYVRADEQGRITDITSDAFLESTQGWTAIDSGYGDAFHHAQGNYLHMPLRNERGICRYRLLGGIVTERTQEEMDADEGKLPAPEMTYTELLLATAADHEYRLCLMELGVTEK